jgi:hypothetical protein
MDKAERKSFFQCVLDSRQAISELTEDNNSIEFVEFCCTAAGQQDFVDDATRNFGD